jgi:hypothetical protein
MNSRAGKASGAAECFSVASMRSPESSSRGADFGPCPAERWGAMCTSTVAGSFQPQNKWVAYAPAQRIRININGDQAHLYFECLYVDVVGKQITAHTFSDDNLVRVGDKWLIKEMKAGPVPEL